MKLPHRRQFLQLAAGGCRAASHLAHRAGASLSDAAGAGAMGRLHRPRGGHKEVRAYYLP
jgi:hypothetical protein